MTGDFRELRVLTSVADGENPFVRQCNAALQATGQVQLRDYSKRLAGSAWPDVWHINWPEAAFSVGRPGLAYLKAAKLLTQIGVARARATTIAWTVHNLEPHTSMSQSLDRWFWPRFHRQVDLFIHLSAAGKRIFLDRFPGCRESAHATLFHPRYEVDAATWPTRIQAREGLALEPSSQVVSTFGRLAVNKQIPTAVRAFRAIVEPDVRYLIAGRPQSHAVEAEIRMSVGNDPRIHVRANFLPEQEVVELLRASDLVLLPYGRFLNSGALLYALSHHRPVLVRATPVTEELRQKIGTPWVNTFGGDLTADKIRAGLHASRQVADREPPLDGLEWQRFAARLMQAYTQVTGVPLLPGVS